MSKFENLIGKADAFLTTVDVAASVAQYASVTEYRISMAPLWAALTVASEKDVRMSLAEIGAAFDEPKPTIDRYVRLGLVLVALDTVSEKQRATIYGLVNAADASRGRISSDAIKAVANEATSATDAIKRLEAAKVKAEQEKAEKDTEKAEKAEQEKAEQEKAESLATDEEIVAGLAGLVSGIGTRLLTMGPDNVDAIGHLADTLAAMVADRQAEFAALMAHVS